MSIFPDRGDELEAIKPKLLMMYEIEELMLRSDFGRLNPERTHEIARIAVGIPDGSPFGQNALPSWEEIVGTKDSRIG